MSDTFWIQLFTFLTAALAAFLAYRAKVQSQVNTAAAKTAAVKAGVASTVALDTSNKVDAVVAKLDENTSLTEDVAKAVNGHEKGKTKIDSLTEYTRAAKHGIAGGLHDLTLKMDVLMMKFDKVLELLGEKP